MKRSKPRSVDVVGRKILKLGHIEFYKMTVRVHLLSNVTWVIALDKVDEKPGARALHPTDCRDRQFEIKHVLLKKLEPFLPADPEIPTSEEHGNTLTSGVMGPAIADNLTHCGVDPRISSPSLFPGVEESLVLFPWELNTERIILHRVKFGNR